MTINATARRVLAALEAASSIGPQTSIGNHEPDADMRALVVYIATVCPGFIATTEPERATDGPRFHSAHFTAPDGCSLGLYHVAPTCYEPMVPHEYRTRWSAYHVLVRLADPTRAREAHVPPAGIEVDGEGVAA